jgi:hypothetical protein
MTLRDIFSISKCRTFDKNNKKQEFFAQEYRTFSDLNKRES